MGFYKVAHCFTVLHYSRFMFTACFHSSQYVLLRMKLSSLFNPRHTYVFSIIRNVCKLQIIIEVYYNISLHYKASAVSVFGFDHYSHLIPYLIYLDSFI